MEIDVVFVLSGINLNHLCHVDLTELSAQTLAVDQHVNTVVCLIISLALK